jgi:hypothetical protein
MNRNCCGKAEDQQQAESGKGKTAGQLTEVFHDHFLTLLG